MDRLVGVVIVAAGPTPLIESAVAAALDQSHPNKTVTVVDDGRPEELARRLKPFLARPEFNYIRIARAVGAAQARNLGLALTLADAYTFHDPGALPDRDKLLVQARVMDGDAASGRRPARDEANCVLAGRVTLRDDGSFGIVAPDLGLVADLLPNLHVAGRAPEPASIASGLFDAGIFTRLGGFAEGPASDREFRNRLIMTGAEIRLVARPLETELVRPPRAERDAASELIAAQVARWRRGEAAAPVPIDLPDVTLDGIAKPWLCALSAALMTARTRERLGAGTAPLRPPRAVLVPSGLR